MEEGVTTLSEAVRVADRNLCHAAHLYHTAGAERKAQAKEELQRAALAYAAAMLVCSVEEGDRGGEGKTDD